MLNEERVTFGAEIQNLRRENEGLREQVAARQAELGALRAQAQRNAATAQAEQARLAAEVQRIRTQIQSGSTEPDPSAGSGPQTLQDEIKALKEQAEKLQDSLAVAQSWRLCLNFQRAVNAIKEKQTDRFGNRLVLKTEYEALDSGHRQFNRFLIAKSDSQQLRPGAKYAADWIALRAPLLAMIDPTLLQLELFFAGQSEDSCWLPQDGFNQINENLEQILRLHPPSPAPTSYSLSEDHLNQLNTALEQFLTKLQEVGGVDRRDMGEPTGD
jgi:DNA repair exonuclease SbcCD ATPase subunit